MAADTVEKPAASRLSGRTIRTDCMFNGGSVLTALFCKIIVYY